MRARLGGNLKDLPFTLTYLLEADGQSARLVAATGFEPGHPGAAPVLTATTSPWPFEAILGSTQSVIVEDLEGVFGEMPAGDWDKPPREALVVPLPQQAHDRAAAGFMVVGLNPYRVGDQNLRDFIGLVAGQIATGLASVRAYEEERRRAAALADIDRAKTTFFSNVSHEFRTPLTLMLGPLEEFLNEPSEGQAARRQVELAHRNGVRLLRLVNSLLDFSRIEAGRVQASYQPTDLAAFSADIASSFRSATDKAGLRLVIDAPALDEPVYLDHEMWEKVILNLMSNAFKFTFEGEISLRVAPGADRTAVVTVADTGVGIPEHEVPKLFERFHRVEGAEGRSFEGSGIGLALVQELVRLHGGDIAVESQEGQGTAVSITLPLGSAHLQPDQVQAGGNASASPARAQSYVSEALRWLPQAEIPAEDIAVVDGQQLPGTGKQILLADDNSDMREYVARLLMAAGYAVEAVGDGEAALESARGSAPDLILSDVMMPGLDGFGLLRAIRSDPNLAGVPTVLLSARAGEEAQVEGLEAGADDYLVKPFAARELIARVNANIQMASMRREASRAIMASEQRYLMTQDRLSTALSTGQVSVFEWAVDEDHLVVQGPLAAVFGVTPEAAAGGLPLADFVKGIHPDDVEPTMAVLNASIADLAPYEAEYRTVGAGEERVVVARGHVELGADGRKRMSGAVIDVTTEKAAEDALRDNRNHLRELLNSTGEGFYAVDRDGVTTLVNRAFLELLRFEDEGQAIGRKLHDVIHHTHPDGTHYPKEDCPIYQAASEGRRAHVEMEYFFRSDGSKLPVEYWAHPVWRDGPTHRRDLYVRGHNRAA